MRRPVVFLSVACPRCGHGHAVAVHGGSAFSLYCRRCGTRLDAAPAIRYGGYTSR